jgi:hypothetical protein
VNPGRTALRVPLLITKQFGYIAAVTERFPHQRNRRSADSGPSPAESMPTGATGLTPPSAHRRPAPEAAPRPAADPDAEMPVFDESFVNAAPVKEASARVRMLEARGRSAAAAQRWRAVQATTSWQIRPSHRLRSIRPTAVGALAGVAVLGVLLFAFLLH